MSDQTPPPPPVAPYGGIAVPPPNHPKAMLSLILGILSFVCCGIFTAIPAFIIGKKAEKEVIASRGTLGGGGLAKAGWILGLASMILTAVAVVFWILLAAVGGTADLADEAQPTPITSTADDLGTEDDVAAVDEPTTVAPPAEKPAAAAPLVVSAEQLVKDFEDNELAADAKYKDQTLQITGTIDKIDTELFNSDKYVLNISGGDMTFMGVSCHGMSQDELSTLQTGDEVTVIGKFDDGGDLGVDVKKCHLP